jgi:hypothetical protein
MKAGRLMMVASMPPELASVIFTVMYSMSCANRTSLNVINPEIYCSSSPFILTSGSALGQHTCPTLTRPRCFAGLDAADSGWNFELPDRQEHIRQVGGEQVQGSAP